MRKIRELQNKIDQQIDACNRKNNTNLKAEIKKHGMEFTIAIFEKIPSHHFFQTPPIKIERLSQDEFLKLKPKDIEHLIPKLVKEAIDLPDEEQDLPRHPGSGISK